MNHNGLEIEFKWQASSNADFERFLAHAGQLGAKIGSVEKIRIRDLYLDTESRYFTQAGVKCRLRQAGSPCFRHARRALRARSSQAGSKWQLTLKTFSRLKKGLAQRQEKEIPLPFFKSQAAALRYLNRRMAGALFSGQSLRGLFEIKNLRTVHRIKLGCGANTEASFDRVTIVKHEKKVLMREIELEFLGGKLPCFKKFTLKLTRSSGLRPQKKSKVATAVSAFGLEMIRKNTSGESGRNFAQLTKLLSTLL